MNTIYNMYKRGLCALCLLTTVGMSVSAQQIRTSYFMQSSTARTTMNPAYRPERGYVSIPVLGAVGASYGTNGIAVDNFIYPKNGETVTFMDNSVNTESFLNGLKDENQVNMDFGTQVLSGGWYAGKGFWTVDVSIKGLANIRAPNAVDPELYPLVVGRMFAGGAPREGGVDVPGHGLVHVALVETQGEHLVVRVQLLDLQRHHDIALGAGTPLVLLGLLARIDLDDDFVHRHDFHVIGIVGVAEQVVVVDAFHASEMDRIDHIGRYFHARRRVLVAYWKVGEFLSKETEHAS